MQAELKFEKQIRHSAWFVLLAALTLILATIQGSANTSFRLAVALVAVVLLVALWSVVLRVARYVRCEHARRRATADAGQRVGPGRAAEQVNDRVSNSLSLTYGYAEFLALDDRLPEEGRQHAYRAMRGARKAAEAVAELKGRLRCNAEDEAFMRALD
jgi:small-conductance mechanosensitive channel